jgi:hypothetical protein
LYHQLAWSPDGVESVAENFYNEYTSPGKRTLDPEDWEKALCDLLRSVSYPVVFVIDALDECKSFQDQRSFLNFMLELKTEHPRLHVLFSSRHHVPVDRYFEKSVQPFEAKSSEADGDMKNFIQAQIRLKRDDPYSKFSIFCKFCAMTSAMFFFCLSMHPLIG